MVFVYKIESTSLNVGIAEDTFNQKDNVHIGTVECTGCKAYTTENDKIEATLEWDGKTETIKLIVNDSRKNILKGIYKSFTSLMKFLK